MEGGLKHGLGTLVEGAISYKGSFKVRARPSRPMPPPHTPRCTLHDAAAQVDVKHGYGEEDGTDFTYKGHFLLGKRRGRVFSFEMQRALHNRSE